MAIIFTIPKYRQRTPVLGYSLSKQETAEQVQYDNVEILEEEALEPGGMFGNAVYGKSVLRATGSVGADLELGNTILDITDSNNIVKTAVVRKPGTGKGTVKEYVSKGDFQITISGVLVSPKGQVRRPNNLIKHLSAFAGLGSSIRIDNDTLWRLGVYDIVIEQLDWIPFQHINTQPFRLTCSSDDPETYKINEKFILDA